MEAQIGAGGLSPPHFNHRASRSVIGQLCIPSIRGQLMSSNPRKVGCRGKRWETWPTDRVLSARLECK